MSKKTIVLADNSYTIRRIVELSFSEEKEIELVSFENSLNLREKLLELRPQIVLVDIKLPEFNGYEVCKFVQESEKLAGTKVFLLKGGFEPVDENMLKNLQYVDIITKPFDSNALVSNIKKLMEEMPKETPPAVAPSPAPEAAVEMPPSVPDDLPEIDPMPESPGDISFSDIKDEIDSDNIMGGEEFVPSPSAYPDEEILPSEEITQAQSSQGERDQLAPPVPDEIDNPFADDMSMEDGSQDSTSLTEEELNIKRNIEMQEKELEIGSLTLEEIRIQKDIEKQEQVRKVREEESAALDRELEPAVPKLEEEDADTSDMFPKSKLDTEESPVPGSTAQAVPDEDQASEPLVESEPVPELDTPSFGEAEEKLFADEGAMPEVNYELEPGTVSPLETQPLEAVVFGDDEPGQVREYVVPPPEPEAPETPQAPVIETTPAAEMPMEEIPTPTPPQPPVEEVPPEKEIEDTVIPEPEMPAPAVVPEPEPAPEPRPQVEAESPIPGIKQEEVLDRLEDKLTHAIKEMLWEIVPPLAEKIIKEEIDTLKAETEKSFT
jgi:CheY-like chemotaxis protein